MLCSTRLHQLAPKRIKIGEQILRPSHGPGNVSVQGTDFNAMHRLLTTVSVIMLDQAKPGDRLGAGVVAQ